MNPTDREIRGIQPLLDVGPRLNPARAGRFWSYIHRWRVSLFQRWKQEVGDNVDPVKLGQSVDHLLGTRLLLHYVRSWHGPDVPSLKAFCAGDRTVSVLDLCEGIQASFSCPILRSVLDPSWAPAAIPVPTTIFESRWEHRIVDAVWLLLGDHPIPLTFFGDYHQLCVANPLGSDCSHRYERGIHYTPAPVVDYLVNNTLGRALAGCSIDEARQLRILDPSCGCGAFLIAAMRYLLRWFEDCTSRNEAARYTSIQDHFKSLGDMLFGVDIDERAVAWTTRLLSLAAWEASIVEPPRTRQPPLLITPDFRRNAVCRSFLDVEPDSLLGRVDVIIGGPPFVRLRELHRSQRTQIREYRRRFQTARRGQFDLYMLFIERALELLADGGHLGFSVANTFIRTIGGDKIRRLISRRSRIIEVVEFEDKEVYPEAHPNRFAVIGKGDSARQISTCSHQRRRRPTDEIEQC